MRAPLIMGILNVTPDSFSDPGAHFDHDDAIRAGLAMVADGADILDVGGESTRPGSERIDLDEELRRVLPVVRELAKLGHRVSIDTMKPEVAFECLTAGAWMVNDVSGLRSPAMRQVCAESGCRVTIMHMLGTPETMQVRPSYDDVVGEVRSYLVQQVARATEDGIEPAKIWIDPGIGFGKTTEHNLALLRGLSSIVATRQPVLIGVSRKAFIGRILGSEASPLAIEDRLEGTLACQVLAQASGVAAIRTHDVRSAVRAAKVAAAILGSR